ncbi:MAG: DUF1281 family ferredoxin-like fold protein [Saccharofermentanales bacterium]
MPNHVKNIVTFGCDDEELQKILEHIKNDEQGVGSIDFEKIIPMPESLNIECGSIMHGAIKIYLTAMNPSGQDFDVQKMSDESFEELARLCVKTFAIVPFEADATIPQIRETMKYFISDVDDNLLDSTKLAQDLIEKGRIYVDNYLNYGVTDWYDWHVLEWDTSYNAYDYYDYQGGNSIEFLTAWNAPEKVIANISRLFPQVEIMHRWADECAGYNVGETKYLSGTPISEHIPSADTKEAYRMSAGVWGVDLEEEGYCLSDDGCTYIYKNTDGLDETAEQMCVQSEVL